MNQDYLTSAIKLFEYYKSLAEKAISQLDDENIFQSENDDTNSIAVIVKHLSGNMISRWTDFLTSDGEKEWRNRDGEFDNSWHTKDEVMEAWEKGWKCFFDALNDLKPEQLTAIIYIRNEGHTVMDAINRQLAHYPYHIGQIVFNAKQLKSGAWDTLSIARNKSGDYNQDKFGQEKGIRHFTDDEMEKRR